MSSVVQKTLDLQAISPEALRQQAKDAMSRYVAIQKACERHPHEIVYFLEAGPFIKIGKATGNVLARVSQLQTGCPYPISVIATTKGGYTLEKIFHDRFRHIRAHGEWFFDTSEIRAFISDFVEKVDV